MQRFQFDVDSTAIIVALKAADRTHVGIRANDAMDPQEGYPVDTIGTNLSEAFQRAFQRAISQYPDCRQYGIFTAAEILAKSSETPYAAERYADHRIMLSFTLVQQS